MDETPTNHRRTLAQMEQCLREVEEGSSPKPLWPKIVWTVVAMVILYVLSFRQACWMVRLGYFRTRPTAIAYDPILRIALYGPGPIANVFWWLGEVQGDWWTMRNMMAERGLRGRDGRTL